MRKLARLLLGLLFVFSGIVKAIDPVGSALVFSEYFNAFGVGFMAPLSLPAGIMLSTLEFVLGVMVLLDFRKRTAAWGMFLFMSFFTLLTLWLAVFDPVQDCGCFGDAIKLSNWQTFFKNLVFWPFSLALFLQRNRTAPVARGVAEWPVCIFFALIITGLSIYSYRHLPPVDFRGFRIGNDLGALLEEARKNPEFSYSTELIYSRQGKEKIFTADSLPDRTWTFVDSRTREIRTGKRHKITDFSVRDLNGKSLTDSILNQDRTALVLLITSGNNLDRKTLQKLEPLVAESKKNNRPYYAISALPTDTIQNVLQKNGLEMPVYLADKKTLLTMIRSTPGLIVMKKGIVLAKFGFRDFPITEKWLELVNQDPEMIIAKTRIHTRLRTQVFVALVLLLIFLLRKGFWFSRERY
ncbi:MAG: BT_3928 family protein [Bacteroidales bacterium]|jgi:uncharacterized membrane protein YphA (DoxX/SURF4 family)